MIKPKLKKCSGCHNDKYLWSSNPPKCKECHNKAKYSGKDEKPKVKKIAQFSDKMLNQLAAYRRLKKKYLLENKDCRAKLDGCTNSDIHIHHSNNRTSNLNNIDTWIPVCFSCHYKIHNVLSMEEAVNLGLMFYRN